MKRQPCGTILEGRTTFQECQKITAEQNLDFRCLEHHVERCITTHVDAPSFKVHELAMLDSSHGVSYAARYRCAPVEDQSLEVRCFCEWAIRPSILIEDAREHEMLRS